jgi:hypothetical protein
MMLFTGFFSFILLSLIPESPMWLVGIGRLAQVH